MAYHASSQLPAYQPEARPRPRRARSRWSRSCSGSPCPSLLALALWAAVSAQKAQGRRPAGIRGHARCDRDATSMPGMTHEHAAAGARRRRRATRGSRPTNADALAAAHRPYPAALEAAPAGPVAVVHLTLKDVVHEVAPGIKYSAWAFSGGAPGPVIHVRQGQTVKMTLTNGGAIPHSIDFHAARIAPNMAFKDVDARASRSRSASSPTTPASSCTTAARSRC